MRIPLYIIIKRLLNGYFGNLPSSYNKDVATLGYCSKKNSIRIRKK